MRNTGTFEGQDFSSIFVTHCSLLNVEIHINGYRYSDGRRIVLDATGRKEPTTNSESVVGPIAIFR